MVPAYKSEILPAAEKTRLFYRQKPSETPVNKGVPVVFPFPYKARTTKTPETSIDKGISRDFTSEKNRKIPATKNSKLFLGVKSSETPINKGFSRNFVSDKK